jgi:hypothetical protein
MTNYNKPEDDISLAQMKTVIQLLQTKSDVKEYTEWMTSALGSYIEKLQLEYNYTPVFPIELLPISKSEIKKWGFDYAAATVKKEGQLKQYQQDAALSYTRFQSITAEQWKAIRDKSVQYLVVYNAEVRDKGISNADIPPEFKSIIDTYRNEYSSEVTELHTYLKSLKKSPLGCLVTALFLSGILISWYYLKT